MELVALTAFGVGGATLLGVVIGFLFKNITHKFSDIVLSFAAGIMFAAAVIGLILPAVDKGGIFVAVFGIFLGAMCINILDKLVPHTHNFTGIDGEKHQESKNIPKIMLFVLAIAIHNLPEGLAAGVAFGVDNAEGLLIAGGIALQNIPEGMAIIGPMLAAGISKKRTFIFAALTGVVEIVGTFIGYFAVNKALAILPYALSFAGGTMLYIISDEMIPETHAHGSQRGATYSFLVGFCLMLVFDFFLG